MKPSSSGRHGLRLHAQRPDCADSCARETGGTGPGQSGRRDDYPPWLGPDSGGLFGPRGLAQRLRIAEKDTAGEPRRGVTET